MKPSEISQALELCVNAGRPVLLSGPPGVGKSATVAQTARRMSLGLIDLRLVQLDPVDLRGLPSAGDDGFCQWLAPAFLPRDGAGILFLDEFPQAVPGVQNAASQLILDRRLGDYVLPAGWSIVAAGNNLTDRAATHRMPSHIASRFVHLDYEIDLDDWTRYALASGIRTEIIAFLRFRPELLHQFDPAQRSFPCPRTWEFCSQILEQAPPEPLELALYAGCVGQGAAAELVGFLRVLRSSRNYPSLDAILLDPTVGDIPTQPALLYAISAGLARKTSESNIGAVVTYAARLPAEFGVFLIREAAIRAPGITQTRGFIDWATRNGGVLI